MPSAPTSISRRDFLKATSVLSGALLGSQWLTALPAAAAPHTDLVLPRLLGILTPTLPHTPAAPNAFVAELQNLAPRTEWQVASYGKSLEQAQMQAQAWLAAGVEGVVGWLSAEAAQTLQPLFEKAGVPLVVCTFGASQLAAGTKANFVLENSLAWWRANYALGQWAVKTLGPRLVSAAAFYDSGYDGLYAFQAGAEAAGGAVTQTIVTHQPNKIKEDFSTLCAAIREAQPDVVFAGYGGPQAVEFLQAYAAAGLPYPLIGAPSLGAAALEVAEVATALGLKVGGVGPRLADPIPYLAQRAAAFLAGASPTPLSFGVGEVRLTEAGYQLGQVDDVTALATITAEHIWSTNPRSGWFHEYGIV